MKDLRGDVHEVKLERGDEVHRNVWMWTATVEVEYDAHAERTSTSAHLLYPDLSGCVISQGAVRSRRLVAMRRGTDPGQVVNDLMKFVGEGLETTNTWACCGTQVVEHALSEGHVCPRSR